MRRVRLRSIRRDTRVQETLEELSSCDFLECLTSLSVRLLIALSNLSAIFGSAAEEL